MNGMIARIVFFSLVPGVPILVMLVATAMLFDGDFVERHLDLVGPVLATSEERKKLREELDATQQSLAKADGLIQTAITNAKKLTKPDADTDKPAEPIKPDLRATFHEIDPHATQLKVHAEPIVDAARPAGLSPRQEMILLRDAVTSTKSALDKAKATLAECACPSSENDLVSDRFKMLGTTLDSLDRSIVAWDSAKARQPGELMAALNATVILIIVAGGALLWSCLYLLPASWGGLRLGKLSELRIAAVGISGLLMVVLLIVTFACKTVPIIPSHVLTMSLFDRTLAFGLMPRGSVFMGWNFVAIALVSAALFATFTAMSFIARTYDYAAPPIKAASATRRMEAVRNLLYVGGFLSVVVMIVISVDFSTAASLFSEKLTETVDNPTRKLIEGISTAAMYSYGISLGLSLAVAYLPAASHLNEAADREAKDAAAKGVAPPGMFSVWGSGAFGTILRFAVVLAPTAVTAITSLIPSPP